MTQSTEQERAEVICTDQGINVVKDDVLMAFIPWEQAACRAEVAVKDCWCTTCRPLTLEDVRFVVCPDCGNKRCPKANNHANACTNSNAVGQPGSSWEHVKPWAQRIEAAPVQMPEPDISTANHAGIRVIGYTTQAVRKLLTAHGICE
jgi:hypothetical protein